MIVRSEFKFGALKERNGGWTIERSEVLEHPGRELWVVGEIEKFTQR